MDTRIYMIVDGSGSMMKDKDDVVDGVNKFIDEQKNVTPVVGENVYFSLTVFDDNVFERIIEENIELVNSVKVSDTFLGGSTALLDAIGRTLTRAENAQQNTPASRNFVYIYTDGLENMSKEFKLEQIKELLDRLQNQNNWTVVYMSAELAQFADAQALGIHAGNYMTTTGSKGSHFAAASAGTTSLRSSGTVSSSNYVTDTGGAVDWDSITIDEESKPKLWTPKSKKDENDPED